MKNGTKYNERKKLIGDVQVSLIVRDSALVLNSAYNLYDVFNIDTHTQTRMDTTWDCFLH